MCFRNVTRQNMLVVNAAQMSRLSHPLGLLPHMRTFRRPHAVQLQPPHHVVILFTPAPKGVLQSPAGCGSIHLRRSGMLQTEHAASRGMLYFLCVNMYFSIASVRSSVHGSH